jgi:hypothetical protein
MCSSVVGAVLLIVPVFTSAAPIEQPDASSFQALVESVSTEGVDNYIRPNVAPHIGFEANARTKAFVIEVEKEKDVVKLGRVFNFLADRSAVALHNSTREKRRLIGRYFKCDPRGTLQKATQIVSKLDENGQVIRGSAVITQLDLASRATKKLFSKELDFWVSGAYKKYLSQKK